MTQKIIPRNGPCYRACAVRRDPRTKRLTSTGQCSCERVAGLRVTPDGPRAHVVPCSCDEVRTDARQRDDEGEGLSLPGEVVAVREQARTAFVDIQIPRGATLDLRRFEVNPVAVWGATLDDPPIGAVDPETIADNGTGGAVRFELRFGRSGELADRVWEGVRTHFIRAAALMCSRQPDGTLEVGALSLVSVAPDMPDAAPSGRRASVRAMRRALARLRAGTAAFRALTAGSRPQGSPDAPKNATTGGDLPYDPWKGQTVEQIKEDEGNGPAAGMPAGEAKALAAQLAEENVRQARRERDERAASLNRRTLTKPEPDPDDAPTASNFDARADLVEQARRQRDEAAGVAWRKGTVRR